MIIKASQRGFGRNLANHLASTNDNDHVSLAEIRGVIGQSLHAALIEMEAISKGTRCQQPFFSVSFNPPQNVNVSHKIFEDAFDTLEEALGLQEQPRVVIYHEKLARRHAHVIWLRVKIDEMKAIRMSHYKRKCAAISRSLYLRHGWDMPAGLQDFRLRDPFHLTTSEWQQNLRQNIDPREVKAACQAAWSQSHNSEEFKSALEEHGLFLARGDKRGFVIVDQNYKVYSLSRYGGINRKDIKARLGSPEEFPNVNETKRKIRAIYNRAARARIADLEAEHTTEISSHILTRKELVEIQRQERQLWINSKSEGGFSRTFNYLAKVKKIIVQAFSQATGLRSIFNGIITGNKNIRQEASKETWESMVFRHNDDSRIHQRKMDVLRGEHRKQRSALAKKIIHERRVKLGLVDATSLSKTNDPPFNIDG